MFVIVWLFERNEELSRIECYCIHLWVSVIAKHCQFSMWSPNLSNPQFFKNLEILEILSLDSTMYSSNYALSCETTRVFLVTNLRNVQYYCKDRGATGAACARFKYFWVVRIEKQILSFVFWEKLRLYNFFFQDLLTFNSSYFWVISSRGLDSRTPP